MESDWFVVLAAGAASYLLGSIPFGLLLARAKGVNIREVGSGNIGATNVFRSVSKKLGLLTFFLDFLKGLLPVLAAKHWLHSDPAAILCGCAAIAGHMFTIFAGFRGGKGVATGAGVVLGIAPGAVGIGLLCWMVVFLLSRYVSLASIITAAAVGISGWMLYYPAEILRPVTITILAAMVIWRHRSNIGRLLKGGEHRFDFKKKRGGTA
ncbi:MAG: glycerol-3-phosphate 1-O-acyltransferase PlsY [Kiritimatiellia bacterium]